jgi:hypothetical protein
LVFGNVGLSGGFAAACADTGRPCPAGHVRFVDGVECRADQARFGGIVIRTGRPRVSPESRS